MQRRVTQEQTKTLKGWGVAGKKKSTAIQPATSEYTFIFTPKYQEKKICHSCQLEKIFLPKPGCL